MGEQRKKTTLFGHVRQDNHEDRQEQQAQHHARPPP
jgi:hypothetical protein